MGLRIFKRDDGGVVDVDDEQMAEIDAYALGKSLAEIAAEPPRFAHLLEQKRKPTSIWRRFLNWLRPTKKTVELPIMTRAELERFAWTFGVTPEGDDKTLQAKIMARLRGMPTQEQPK